MDGGTVGVTILVVVNIAVAAYSYGKLSQKVNDLCRRVDRVEKMVNHRGKKDEEGR